MVTLIAPGFSPYSRTVVDEGTPGAVWDKHRNAFTITEPKDVGLKRYGVIAKAIASYPPTVRRYLVTMFHHESGFREDIHSGVGEYSRGDCKWTGGKVGKGRQIPGTCRSVCSGQVLFDPPDGVITVNGINYTQKDLVGTDLASTERCAHISATVIKRAMRVCKGDHPFCVIGIYGGVSQPLKSAAVKKCVNVYEGLR